MLPNAIENIIEGIRPAVEQITDDFFPNTVTITRPTSAQDDSGQWVDGPWQPVVGLSNMRAVIETMSAYQERTQVMGLTFDEADYHVTIGTYPFNHGIVTSDRFTDEDGTIYEIQGVQDDPYRLMLQLLARRSATTDDA